MSWETLWERAKRAAIADAYNRGFRGGQYQALPEIRHEMRSKSNAELIDYINRELAGCARQLPFDANCPASEAGRRRAPGTAGWAVGTLMRRSGRIAGAEPGRPALSIRCYQNGS